jgi:hypothetical protein
MRNNAGAVSATNGALNAWNPNVFGTVYAIARSGTLAYIGGAFTVVNSFVRNSLAAVDAVTGALQSWNPGTNGQVTTLSVVGGTLYAGGDFTIVRGQPRDRLAALDPVSGQLTAWDPDADGAVLELQPAGSAMLLFGAFGKLGGLTRPNVGAVDIATGATLGLYPRLNGSVATLSVVAGAAWVGGAFSLADGQPATSLTEFPLTALLDAPMPTAAPGALRVSVAPNPGHGAVTVEFALAATADVQVRVFDVNGRAVAGIAHSRFAAGRHRLTWDGRTSDGPAAPGVYLVQVRAGGIASARRVVLAR